MGALPLLYNLSRATTADAQHSDPRATARFTKDSARLPYMNAKLRLYSMTTLQQHYSHTEKPHQQARTAPIVKASGLYSWLYARPQ
jgi:hypothetical protein